MKKLLLILSIFALISGCATPQQRAKRKVDKILKKFPEIVETKTTTRADTIVKIDSIINERRSFDSTFIFHVDSIYIVEKAGVKTEVKLIETERIYIKTEVKADTFIMHDTTITDTIYRDRIISVKDEKETRAQRLYRLFFFWGLFIVALYFAIRYISNKL